MVRSIIYLNTNIIWVIKKNEMDGASGTYGGEVIYFSSGETCGKEIIVNTQALMGR